MARKVYMVDTENVNSSWRMILADMTRNDILYLFYTEHSPGIGYADFKEIMESEVRPEMISCYSGKNGLDFQLVSYLGYLLKSAGKTEYIIISNDMGYDSVIHFWTDRGYKIARMTVYDLIQRKKTRIAQKRAIETVTSNKAEKETVTIKDTDDSQKIIAIKKDDQEQNSEIPTAVPTIDIENPDVYSAETSLKKGKASTTRKMTRKSMVIKKNISEEQNMGVSTDELYVFGNPSEIHVESKRKDMLVDLRTSESQKGCGRKKKDMEKPAKEPSPEFLVEVSEKVEEDKGRQFLADLLSKYGDIDIDTVIEVLRHGSIHQLQKIYTQMLKLFGHQTGMELYRVLKPHFSVLFTYAKKDIQS